RGRAAPRRAPVTPKKDSAAKAARPPSPARAAKIEPFLSRWLLAGPLALLVAFVAARQAPLGTPICDDYRFLAALRFDHPLDWLGSMGAAFYWRPIARQAYYALLGPTMFAAPGVSIALHALLFLAVFALAWDVARRSFP